METKEIVRVFKGSDAFMIESARVCYNLMFVDIASFTQLDSTFNAGFATGFLKNIVAAEIVAKDTAIIDQGVQKTEIVTATLQRARDKYQDVKYFVRKAFPHSAATQGEFGIDGYRKARRNTVLMVAFLQELYVVAQKYEPELAAKGFTAQQLAEIDLIAKELTAESAEQQINRHYRGTLTEGRINILNACFATMAQVNEAAQLVYKTDFAKRKQFIYWPAANKGE